MSLAPEPLISIVLPTRNGARHLQASIDSCLSQTWRRLELILIDDGSDNPETAAILARQNDPRVRLARLERNVGLPRALNEGFRRTQGDLLTWTSDDNRYRPTALETMARTLGRAGADFIYTRATVIDDAGRTLGTIAPRPPEFLPIDNGIGPCFLYTRRAMEAVGEYDPDMVLAEDYDYWIRIAKQFRAVCLDEDLYEYREHGATLTATRGRPAVQAAIDRARRKHFTPGEILAAEGLRAFDRGDRAAARRLLTQALARRPADRRLWRPAAVTLLPAPLVRLIVQAKAAMRKTGTTKYTNYTKNH